jgi:hypothetical protein
MVHALAGAAGEARTDVPDHLEPRRLVVENLPATLHERPAQRRSQPGRAFRQPGAEAVLPRPVLREDVRRDESQHRHQDPEPAQIPGRFFT